MGSIKDKVTLARLEERMIAMSGSLERVESLLAEQNGRVDRLEGFKNKLIGIAAGVSALISIFVKKVL